MLGDELRVIDNIVDAKHGLTYYHVTHLKPNSIQQVRTKVFTRFIVAIEEF